MDNKMKLVDGLQIIGVDYQESSTKDGFEETLAQFSISDAVPSILLKHEPKHLDVARDAGISLQISGHTHRGQMCIGLCPS